MKHLILITTLLIFSSAAYAGDRDYVNRDYGFGTTVFSDGATHTRLSFSGAGEGEVILQGFSNAQQTSELSFGDDIKKQISSYTFGEDASGVRGTVTGDAFGEVTANSSRNGYSWGNSFGSFGDW